GRLRSLRPSGRRRLQPGPHRQALRAHRRRRGHRRGARRSPPAGRGRALQLRDRGRRRRRGRPVTIRIGVITWPGSLDDRDAQRAVRIAGAEPVALWHGSHDLEGVDALVLPGGFSYGDYLRSGAIAALSPIMTEVKAAAAKGMPILGICNGFQMLVEAHLLPGGLIRNDHQHFVRRDQRLTVENTSSAWTNEFTKGQEIVIPLKNAEG